MVLIAYAGREGLPTASKLSRLSLHLSHTKKGQTVLLYDSAKKQGSYEYLHHVIWLRFKILSSDILLSGALDTMVFVGELCVNYFLFLTKNTVLCLDKRLGLKINLLVSQPKHNVNIILWGPKRLIKLGKHKKTLI